MIKNVFETIKKYEDAHNGKGKIHFSRIFSKVDFKTKINSIDYSIVPPQSSVGVHTHGQNEEIYFIIKGEGKMTLGEKIFKVKPGDVIVNGLGGTHGLENESDTDIHMFVFEVGL